MIKNNFFVRAMFLCLITFTSSFTVYAGVDISMATAVGVTNTNDQVYSVTNNENVTEGTEDFVSGKLLNLGGNNLTPNPNEKIDPYSGTFKLHYIDFSVPVGPGLNMEVHRTYNSSVYNPIVYIPRTHGIYNFILPSWEFGATYLLAPSNASCAHNKASLRPCSPILYHADGSAEVLHVPEVGSNRLESYGHSVFDIASMTMVDNKGLKYYFHHEMTTVNGGYRFYLRRVQNQFGQWIDYEYSGASVSFMRSSDGKVLQIAVNNRNATRYDGTHAIDTVGVPVPTGVIFGNKWVVSYDYEQIFSDATISRLALKKVTKANSETEIYKYDYYNIRNKTSEKSFLDWVLLLTEIQHDTGELTQYTYEPDVSVTFADSKWNGRQLQSRTHVSANKYIQPSRMEFIYNLNVLANGIKTKDVTVKGPYHTALYSFSHAQDNYAWRTGMPLQTIIFTDNTTQHIASKEIYTWEEKLLNNYPYYASSAVSKNAHDIGTYIPALTSKTVSVYNSGVEDKYTIEQQDFDEHTNPQTLILTSSDGSKKVIKKKFYNNKDKNILGLLASLEINGKKVIERSYDDNGNLITDRKFGVDTNFSYLDGFLASKTDANGNTTRYANYSAGIPQLTENPDKTTNTKTINPDGTIASETDAKGNTTRYEYNPNQQLIRTIPVHGESTEIKYSGLNKHITLGNSQSSEEYNYAGLLINKQVNNNHTVIRYDALGRKIFESFAFNNPSQENAGTYYQYDSANRVLSACYPAENQNCTTYDYFANNTIKNTAPTGEYTVITYKSYGSPSDGKAVKIVEDRRTTTISRDELNYVTAVTQGSGARAITKSYAYDPQYNLIKYVEPETGVTEYRYDKVGNLLEKKQNNQSTNYIYNAINKLTNISYSDDSYPESFEYDKNSNLVKAQKGNIVKTYSYDALNRLIGENLSTSKNTDVLKVAYKYNQKGDLESIVYPDDTQIDLTPNEDGKPTRVGAYMNNISYHPNGFWSGFSFNNSINASTSLDDLNRIYHYKYGSMDLDYDYDENNNLRSLALVDTKNPSYNHNLSFNYDLLGRLIKANGPWGSTRYDYDANDNIINIDNVKNANDIANLSEPKKLQFQYDDKMHLNYVKDAAKGYNTLDSFSYDTRGNITSDKNNNYIYGLDGNLLTVNGKSKEFYEYDTDHNRVVKSEKGLSPKDTIAFYSKDGQLLYEYEPASKKAVKNIYFNGHKVVRVESDLTSPTQKTPTVNYYYNDSIGSPVAMADSLGKTLWVEVYQPYGLRVTKQDKNSPSSSNKYWFAGKEVDSSDLSYFGARYYNSTLGRFMSPDPVAVDPEKPSTFNRYAYGNNNPYKYVDPDGRFGTPLEFFIGFGIGALANQDKGITGMLVGGFIGGVAGATTSIANSRIMAVAGYNLVARLAASSISEVAINTTTGIIANTIINKDPNFANASGAALVGSVYNRIFNPIGYSPTSLAQSILFSNKSIAVSIAGGKFMDSVHPSHERTTSESGGFYQGFGNWNRGFYNYSTNKDMKFANYSDFK